MEVTGVKAHTINNLISVVEHNQSFVYEYAGYPLMPAPSLCGAESAREFINIRKACTASRAVSKELRQRYTLNFLYQ